MTMSTAPAPSADQGVLWISPGGWEDQMELHPLHDPISLSTWLRIISNGDMEVILLPYDTLIQGGPFDGGRVVAVEADNGRHFFALAAEALSALQGLVSRQAYAEMVRQTPRLAGIEAARAILGQQ